MGKRGPRRKLAVQEYLEGNPSKNKRLLSVVGIEAQGEPFVAEHLMDDARGCIEVIQKSMPPRVYSALDSFLLAAFGVSWAVHKWATVQISNPDFEYVVTTYNADGDPTGYKTNPVIAILNKQALVIASLGDRLGLDPKSRQGLGIQGTQQQGRQSKFAGLLTPRPAQEDDGVIGEKKH